MKLHSEMLGIFASHIWRALGGGGTKISTLIFVVASFSNSNPRYSNNSNDGSLIRMNLENDTRMLSFD